MAKRLGDLLKEKNLITDEHIKVAIAHQKITGELLGDILVKLGFISSKERAMILAEQAGIEFLDMETYTLSEEALRLVPKTIAERFQFLPVGFEDGRLIIAVTKTGNIQAVDMATKISKKSPKICLMDSELFSDLLEKAYFFLENPIEKHIDKITEDIKKAGNPQGEDIVSLVDLLVLDAIRKRSTDIHLTPIEYALNIFYRIDGVLQHQYCLPKNTYQGLISRIKILSSLDIAETRLPQDGGFTFKFSNKEYDIRVSFIPTLYGQNCVLRILASNISLLRLELLGFSESNIKVLSELFQRPNGIVLITGPTGSGKTTTLYAGLRMINLLQRNVITMEDPVEYKLNFVRQSQVHERIGYNFSTAAKTFLRQDPDVILLGEIRDLDSANIAIRASITGHLVLSSLHTNDAVTAIPRLIDLGADRFLVSSSLLGIVAQRLLRTICPFCKESYDPPQEELEYLKSLGVSERKLWKGRGCGKCNDTGYLGRTAIAEVMSVNEELRELIYQGASVGTLKAAAIKSGMVPMLKDGVNKVLEGRTTPSELKRVLG
ncbi:MAG: GspE/PulE family protein [Desulfatiglandales bacterium]